MPVQLQNHYEDQKTSARPPSASSHPSNSSQSSTLALFTIGNAARAMLISRVPVPGLSADVDRLDRCTYEVCYTRKSCAAGKALLLGQPTANKLMVFNSAPSQTRLRALLCRGWGAAPDWWAPCHLSPPSNICASRSRAL